VTLTFALTFSNDAGFTSEKQMRNTSCKKTNKNKLVMNNLGSIEKLVWLSQYKQLLNNGATHIVKNIPQAPSQHVAVVAAAVVVSEVKTVAAVTAGPPPPPPPSSEVSGQTDKNVDKVCRAIRGADGVQLTMSRIAMIIQYMPTHFTQGRINVRQTSAQFMPHLSDYDQK
jgi:hypothetical protein